MMDRIRARSPHHFNPVHPVGNRNPPAISVRGTACSFWFYPADCDLPTRNLPIKVNQWFVEQNRE